jgi:hypothetical protein
MTPCYYQVLELRDEGGDVMNEFFGGGSKSSAAGGRGKGNAGGRGNGGSPHTILN